MSDLPECPQWDSEYSHVDGSRYICPECAHEWSMEATEAVADEVLVVRDSNGDLLQDGDAVTVIKEQGKGLS